MKSVVELNLAELRQANKARQISWPGSTDWRLGQWSNALCGEVGEVANLIKKLERGDFDLRAVQPQLADELADALIYLDLLAMRSGIDLAAAVRSKFNRKSREIGSDVVL